MSIHLKQIFIFSQLIFCLRYGYVIFAWYLAIIFILLCLCYVLVLSFCSFIKQIEKCSPFFSLQICWQKPDIISPLWILKYLPLKSSGLKFYFGKFLIYVFSILIDIRLHVFSTCYEISGHLCLSSNLFILFKLIKYIDIYILHILLLSFECVGYIVMSIFCS